MNPDISSSRHQVGRSPLFWVTQAAAGLLMSLVFLTPLFDNDTESRGDGWQRLVALFARDAAVRRTAIGSALGLAVTACVFFQAQKAGPPPTDAPARTPGTVIGA